MKNAFLTISRFLLLAGSILAFSCSGSGNTDEGVALVISAEIQTRVSGGSWDAGDEIGVFMTNAAASSSIIGNQYNKLYATDGSGRFSAAQQEIYFPDDDTPVKVIAYFPYTPYVYEDMLIPINLAVQSEADKVDLMTATHTSGLSKVAPKARLQFYHRLAKLTFNIEFDNSVQVLTGTQLLIDGMDTKAVYDLAEGVLVIVPSQLMMTANPEAVEPSVQANLRAYSALVLPRAEAGGVVFVLMLPDGKLHTCPMGSDLALTEGQNYQFNMSFTADGGLTILSVVTDSRR